LYLCRLNAIIEARNLMKPWKILLFLLSLFAVLFVVWYYYPAEGVRVGDVTLRFPSYENYLHELQDTTSDVDVDAVLGAVQDGYEIPESSMDTVEYFFDYLTTNSNRIYLPNDDYTFFDSLFVHMDSAAFYNKVLRVLHYGDSQLEMDRISAVFRDNLQQRFGGSGPGMVPLIQRVPTVSLSQTASGGITRFAMVGDSLTRRAAHHRYGPLTQFCSVYGAATFTFRKTTNRYSQPLAKEISRIGVLLGQNSAGFSIRVKCDTLEALTAVLDSAKSGVSLVSWNLPADVERGTITFKGSAEIYGIMLDDANGGVAVDNVALRGSSGAIFTTIAEPVMKESLELDDTRLIILQFGGNAMPGIKSRKGISLYMKRMVPQFEYFRKVAPGVPIMFIGPADMGRSRNGKVVSWPLLDELNDSLKVTCLNNGVAYWDTFHVMGGSGSMGQWVNHSPALAGPDMIHFTYRGATEIGDALSKSFFLYHDFYQLRKDLDNEAVLEYIQERADSLRALGDTLAQRADSLATKKDSLTMPMPLQ